MTEQRIDETRLSDRISLTGVKAFGRHGVFDHEKRDGQEFIADMTVWVDLHAATISDELADTVDYGQLAELTQRIIAGTPHNLIETVAGKIAEEVLLDSKVAAVEVTLHKPSAPISLPFQDVSITLYRGRKR